MKRVTLALALFAAISFSAAAQDFTPYPYIQLQGGVSYDFSEAADFAKLLSPAAQVAVGYRFDELWGARLAVNGWNAKHTSQDTQTLYGFQFVQPNLDLILDWSSALCGWRPDRPVTVYSFVGAGAAIGLENKKANELAESEYFKALWQPVKTFWSIRPGLGVDIRLSNRIGLVDDLKDPKKVEMALWKIVPPEEGNSLCHRLVYHGREVCTARTTPHCDRCCLAQVCRSYPAFMMKKENQ